MYNYIMLYGIKNSDRGRGDLEMRYDRICATASDVGMQILDLSSCQVSVTSYQMPHQELALFSFLQCKSLIWSPSI